MVPPTEPLTWLTKLDLNFTCCLSAGEDRLGVEMERHTDAQVIDVVVEVHVGESYWPAVFEDDGLDVGEACVSADLMPIDDDPWLAK